MILIISSKRDGHINWVSRHLDSSGCSWVRLNIEDVPKNLDITIDPASGKGNLVLHDSGLSFNLDEVTAVWYRKPDPLDISHFELAQAGLDYVEAEFNEIIQGLYALLSDVLWINNPFNVRMAHRKMLQLKVAQAVGFNIPPSIVTNNIQDALEFAERVNWSVAIKSLGAISVSEQANGFETQYGIFTRKIGKNELESLQDKIPFMPTMYQQYIDKEYELRITCVGRKVFNCRIFSQNNEFTQEDMRFDTRSLAHEVFDCPELHEKLFKYMDTFNINFGCFDVAYTKTGEYVFFECNPNGQWLWIEDMTGLPIGRAIAELLASSKSEKSFV